MFNVTFGSTYRIPLTQEGVNAAKRQRLKESLSKTFQNVLYPSGNIGNVRISVRKHLDARVEKLIKDNGFRVYQKFERNNVSKGIDSITGVSKMDMYIKEANNAGEYQQVGKQKAKQKFN